MSELKGKIDFTLFVSADNANPNGDPLNGNRPRINMDGYGEISDVCIKRKIRNRLQDLGQKIFVQSDDRTDDPYTSLKDRAGGISPYPIGIFHGFVFLLVYLIVIMVSYAYLKKQNKFLI